MEFGSSGRDGPGFSSSSPSSSSSSPQYKTGSIIGGIGPGHAGALSSAIYDGPDTKLELMNSSSPKNDDASAAAEGQRSSAPAASVVEKEHMFDKVVTPSDVGKLNRLVIPKQHAEKYFPLDSSTNEKGLLLNFEDRNGKPWRFRYSYWNSSQSYVMTKGWSRFVKEKKLDAGDVVSFQRGVGELSKDRLFIDWRRRPDAPDQYHHHSHHGHHHHHHLGHAAASMFHHGSHIPAAAAAFSYGGRPVPWSPALMRPPTPRDGAAHMQYLSPSAAMSYGAIGLHHSVPYRNSYGGGGGGGEGGAGGGTGSTSYAFGGHVPSTGGPVFYLRSPAAGTPQLELEQQQQQQAAQVAVHRGGAEAMVFDSVPVAHGKAAEAAGGKRLRLFGVNMECPTSEGHEECELLSSTTTISSSSSSINNASQAHHPLQLRLYNGTPIAGISTVDYLNKGKASMTLNFDI